MFPPLMAPHSFVSVLALFLALTVHVSAFDYSNTRGTLEQCVNKVYPQVQQWVCTFYGICNANLCDDDYALDMVADVCDWFSGNTGTVITNKCNASGARPQSGAIAGGVVGGLAGVAVMGAVGAIAYHMSVKAIPAISHMGIAGAGGGASQGASGAASAAAHTAYAAHAAHAAQAAHAAHAGHAATAGQAGAQGGAQMTQHSAGAASAGHTLGAGAGPYMGDGGASHAIGQGAAQVPIGTDGGSTMSGGQSFMPSSSQGMGSPLAAPSDFGQGMYPDPASSGASAPLQGYSAPSFPPAGPHGGVGLGVASPGYTPTTTSFPSPPLSTPSSGTPFFVPNTPYPESSRLSLFGRSRKSIRDEENRLNSPGSPVSTVPSFPPQPHTIVDNSQLPSYPPQPTSTRIPAPPQTSIEYAGAHVPHEGSPSDNTRTA